ncbi:MAG TPA: rhodanese-like domain-containing protein, partial [Polyangia bacterium]|nr:rhodanese-like domain-containing protein [Polyangia bacterium]
MILSPITRPELQARLSSPLPPVLLEALPEGYFLKGHLPRARHFPHDRARELAATVVPKKDAEIVVYCASATCANSG